MSNLKLRITKLQGKTMNSNIYKILLVKHCRRNKWGPIDEGAQIYVVAAMAIKDYPDHPKHDTAISILEWASTRPDLELLERAERVWDDYVAAGLFPVKPLPWIVEPIDPGEVMPPLPFYYDRNQLLNFRQCSLWQ